MSFKLSNWLKTNKSSIRIGLNGLPETAGFLTDGCLHSVSIDDDRARKFLLINTAFGAIEAGCRVTIVSIDPVIYCDNLQSAGFAGQASSLNLFRLLPDVVRKLDELGCRRFLMELEDTGVSPGDLILLENADLFFDWSDSIQARRQARTYQQWFADWRITGVFLFSSKTTEYLCTIFGHLSDGFSGIAELRHDLGHYQWRVRRWRSDYGLLEGKVFEVYSSTEGTQLIVAAAPSQTDLDKDSQLVYCTANVLDAADTIPDGWLICQGYTNILSVAGQAVAASVVLHYQQQQAFHQLAQTVYMLRVTAGRDIKIIVREKGIQLRYSQELLLVKLGVNQVVYMEFGISRLLWAVESLKEQRFTGHVEENFDEALAAAIPSEVCGYLTPSRFCDVVRATLHKTEIMDMHHVLVRLDMIPEKAHLDVLLNCQPKRSNDIVTADEAHIYLFLFACREPDIEAVLMRVFVDPLDQLFTGQSHWSGCRNILETIDYLFERARKNILADFSQILPNPVRQIFPVTLFEEKYAPKTESKKLLNEHSSIPELTPVTIVRTVERHTLKLRG